MIEYYDRFVVDLCPESGSRYVVSDNAGDGVAIAFVNDIEEALDAIHDFLEREKLREVWNEHKPTNWTKSLLLSSLAKAQIRRYLEG